MESNSKLKDDQYEAYRQRLDLVNFLLIQGEEGYKTIKDYLQFDSWDDFLYWHNQNYHRASLTKLLSPHYKTLLTLYRMKYEHEWKDQTLQTQAPPDSRKHLPSQIKA